MYVPKFWINHVFEIFISPIIIFLFTLAIWFYIEVIFFFFGFDF